MSNDDISQDIAIVGMTCRFPGANNIEEYWSNLCNGIESISFFSDEEIIAAGIDENVVKDPKYVKAGALIEDVDKFDASFFGYSPREADMIDPQQRIFLECSWELMEKAGYNAEKYDGKIGVFAGVGPSSYMLFNILSNSRFMGSQNIANHYMQIIEGNDKDHIATRVSYKMNLRGPSMDIQTSCSTSLVAVNMACQSLLDYQSDMAIAGGASIRFPQKSGYKFVEGGILSPDGHCRPFDAKAQGTISSDGVGVVLLKRLEDAIEDGDNIYAIIKGSAINNDGSFKVGYTAPSIEGQSEVIAEALEIAEFNPESIGYIEAHGTGTAIGDPIEIAALTKVFKEFTNKKQFCGIGSVKSNFGHLNAASGVAGLMKAALMIKNGMYVPSINFDTPNPHINFKDTPFYVIDKLKKWENNNEPRRAGVSSFGIGGTNVHMVLEEYKDNKQDIVKEKSRKSDILVMSARSSNAVKNISSNLCNFLSENKELEFSDVAYTLKKGRKLFNHRQFVVGHNIEEAINSIKCMNSDFVLSKQCDKENTDVVFMFTGQGSQYLNMGLDLYKNEPIFKENMDLCSKILLPNIGIDLIELLYKNNLNNYEREEQLNQTRIAQPAIFAIEYSLAQLFLNLGIKPVAMIGNSLGEYVAATISGVFDIKDALRLIAVRAKMMQEMPKGSMLAVSLTEEEIKKHLKEDVCIASINEPSVVVISGDTEIIKRYKEEFTEKNVLCRDLNTSHAFHSFMMDSMIPSFLEELKKVEMKKANIPYVSNLTGTWINNKQDVTPEYWVNHLRNTVQLQKGISLLSKYKKAVFLEIGPGRTLSSLTKRQLVGYSVFASMRHKNEVIEDDIFLTRTIGSLWMEGVDIDWDNFYGDRKMNRVIIPTYPFERKRFFIEPSHSKVIAISEESEGAEAENSNEIIENELNLHERQDMSTPYVEPQNTVEKIIVSVWEDTLGIGKIGVKDNFYELGGNSMILTQIVSKLKERFPLDIPTRNLFEADTVEKFAEVIITKLAELEENS